MNLSQKQKIVGPTCDPGYYDPGSLLCLPCHPTCFTCNSGTKYGCLTCISGSMRTINGSQCTCPNGYYDQSDLCLLCHFSCASCFNNSQYACTSCSSTNYRTANVTSGACVCMTGFYEVGSALCHPCHGSCLTCSVSATSCTSCLASPGRFQAGNTCLCQAGYADVYLNGTCSLCHYSCTTCSGLSATTCTGCPTNRTLSSGSCLCPTGFYDDGSSVVCQPCALTCLNCTNGLSSGCTACSGLYLRWLSPSPTGSCLCNPGFFDSGVLLCSPCSTKCQTCVGTAANCSSCISSQQRTISSSYVCQCVTGYYDAAGLDSCLQCSSSCLSCTGSPTFCTACNSDRYLSSSNTCLCNNGTFQNTSGLCQICSYTCLTCSGSSICLTCRTGVYRYPLVSTCPCIAGYYDNGLVACAQCPYSCANCTSATICTSCPVGSLRTLLSNQSCGCGLGYYDDGANPTCLPCKNTCRSCQHFSQCLSCDNSTYRLWDSLNLLCRCLTNYYENGTNVTCVPCHYSCATCSGGSNTDCITCQPFRTLTVPNSCPCQIGTFQLYMACTSCSLTCLSCSITSTNCTSCSTGSSLINYQCLCSPGFFRNGLICSPCDSSCQTCDVTATNCLTCNITRGTILSGTSCACPNGRYPNTDYICVVCHPFCLTCSGAGPNACITCTPGLSRTINSTTSNCRCMDGYYQTSSFICQACSPPCSTCNGGSVLNCTSCQLGYTLIGSFCRLTTVSCANYYYQGYCVNSCPNTTYPLASSCLPCINYCLTCISSAICTSCTSPFNLHSNGSCLGSCPTGTYAQTNKCLSCPSNCTACNYRASISSVVCLTCSPSYYLSNNLCLTNCPTGQQTHILLESRCVPCIHPCRTCANLSSTGCLSCVSGYILFSGACLSQCPEGYYLNGSNCIPCPSSCLTCLSSECLSCAVGYYLYPSGICIRIGYYLSSNKEELRCHPNCLTCTDSSFSSCIACNQYRGDSSTMAISGYCDCWKGSVDVGDGTCDVESFNSLQRANEVLVSGSTAVTYTTMLASIVTLNPMSGMAALFYQQQMGNFYFVNSSAVGQTDLILEKYGQSSPNSFLNSFARKDSKEADRNFGRRLERFVNLQDTESLFMRGQNWQYLSDWALVTMTGIAATWLLIVALGCAWNRANKKGICSKVLELLLDVLKQSSLILIHFLTINEVSLYAFASFKIIASGVESIDYFKLVLSVALASYYLIYLVRLIVAGARSGESQAQSKRFVLLFGCFERSKRTVTLSRIYLPLLMAKSVLFSLFLVLLSQEPKGQMLACLLVFCVWCIYSLRFCPYSFYIRVFVRLYEVFFLLQLTIMTVAVFKPEGSRMGTAIALIIVNWLQMANFIGLAFVILLYNVYGIKCASKKQKAVMPFPLNQISLEKQEPISMVLEGDTTIQYDIEDGQQVSSYNTINRGEATSYKKSRRKKKINEPTLVEESIVSDLKQISKGHQQSTISQANLASIEEDVSAETGWDQRPPTFSRTDPVEKVIRKKYKVRRTYE